MRRCLYENDPILQRQAQLEGEGWRPMPGVGFRPRDARLLNYSSIFLFLLLLSLPTLVAGLDPIAASKPLYESHGDLVAIGATVLLIATQAICHEALHVSMHPDFGRSDRTIVGMDFTKFFVLYDGPQSVRRFYAMLLAPLLLWPLVLITALIVAPGAWPFWLVLGAGHICGCSGDLFLLFRFRAVGKGITQVWIAGTALMGR